jgi:hypothetical protein
MLKIKLFFRIRNFIFPIYYTLEISKIGAEITEKVIL